MLHALKGSGINSNPRIVELLEQAEFMLDQTNKVSAQAAEATTLEENPEDKEGAPESPESKTGTETDTTEAPGQ